MARHRRHRHAVIRHRPRDDGRAAGWRQILKTPTFALGLSVVAAAALAFGSTQTYLRFSGSGPDPRCGPARTANCANPAASPNTSPVAPGTAQAAARDVRVTYRTLTTSPTGFTGELIITNRSTQPLQTWHLAIAYKTRPPVSINDVTGAQWQPQPGRAGGTITPAPLSDPLGAHQTVRLTYTGTGAPHAPTSCALNGIRCHIK